MDSVTRGASPATAIRCSISLTVVLAERLAFAQRLLEKTDQSVGRVSDLVGFGSVTSLRHHFRRAFGVSPMTWRLNFGGAQPSGR